MTSLGHAHPAVAEAVADQAGTLSHVSNLFGNTVGPEVAVTLDRLIGGGSERAGGQVFFANSGAEANECALKLARRWAGPGRFAVVSTWDAFHGRTLAALAATGQPEKQTAFRPMPEGFDHVPYDDLEAMEAACDPTRVAAVLVEPVQGEAGVVVPSSDYLAGLRQLCTDRNILLMVDEVQTGLGPHRALVRLPAPGHQARHRDHGQGPGQRHAGRGVLGPGRGGRRLRARRPRQHLRRPAPGHVGRPGHPGRHGGRGRARPGRRAGARLRAGSRPCRRRLGAR